MTSRDAELRASVQRKYEDVARCAQGHFAYPVGRESALGLGYRAEWLDAAPEAAVARFVGVGNPFSIVAPRPGSRVLDVGCGAGLDAFVAAHLGARSVGLDLTAAMLPRSRAAAFVQGAAEALPFPGGAFDVVISNGALNLVPDKDAAFAEIARVLRPGGAFAAADLLVVSDVPESVLADPGAWST